MRKRGNRCKKTIVCLIAMVGMSMCVSGCGTEKITPQNTPSNTEILGESAKNETASESNISPEEKQLTAKDCVKDAFEVFFNLEDEIGYFCEIEYHVPEITIDCEGAKVLNEQIQSDCEDAKLIEGESEYDYYPQWCEISYEANVNGDYLSVVLLKESLGADYLEYRTYNLNIATGEIATKEELAQYAGIKEADIIKALRKASIYEADQITLECMTQPYFQNEEDDTHKQEIFLEHLVARFVTGLWNGRCFREKARDELQHNHGKEYQLISLDIEHFKYVNNDFGEKAADRVLIIIAERLRQIFGKEALYAREMGDRYFILTKKRDDLEQQLIKLAEPIGFKNNNQAKHFYKPMMKFGICSMVVNKKDFSIAEYIDAAVVARKSIKRDHTKQFAYYDDYMEAEARIEARIEKRMEHALRTGEFTVYYQPKYLLENDEIIGAEALVRWNDPNEGIVSPGAFIPIFERNGFIIQLDFFVYEEVIKELKKRITEGKRIVPISVNVSRIHISTGDFLQKLIALTEQYELDRELVELELTETVLGGKRQNTIEYIKECKNAGFHISIDDFGSGYSSLNLLKEMPVDVLKIDREFLNELEESEKSSIIVQQVVEMARRIKIKTLCEGVETMKQAEFLKEIGCNMVQGYLYSRPIPVDKFEALLDEQEK